MYTRLSKMRGLSRSLAVGFAVLFLQVAFDLMPDPFKPSSYQELTHVNAQLPTEDPRPKREIPAATQQFGEKMTKFEKAMEESDYETASEILTDIIDRPKRYNSNEIAQAHRMFAWVYLELEDFTATIEQLEAMLNYREQIPYGLEEQALFTLSQLYFTQEAYDRALDYVLEWYELALVHSPQNYVYISQIYLTSEDYENVKYWILLAIEAAQADPQLEVKESWWKILLAAHRSLEEYSEALTVVQTLVKKYPKREYWIVMAQMYLNLDQEQEASWTFELAHVAGHLSLDRDLRAYTQRLAAEEAFVRSAWYLKDGLDAEIVERTPKNVRRLGSYWQRVQELDDAIVAYEEAGKEIQEGKLFHQLALLYNQVGRYNDCVDATETALEIGALTSVRGVQLLKGVCLFSDGKLSEAEKSFDATRREARDREEENIESSARTYLKFINSEYDRIEYKERIIREERQYQRDKQRG